jgi:hypothetical protein
LRTFIEWLGVVAGTVVAFYTTLAIALSCFDCPNPPATWQLLDPWCGESSCFAR